MKINTGIISHERVVPLLIIISSVGLLIFSTWCGLGITHDSVHYLKGGMVLSHGGEFSDIGHPNMLHNGPLLPLLLSFFSTNAAYYYRFLSLLYLIITLFSFRYLIYNTIENKHLRLLTFCAIAYGTPLFLVYNFLWTESAFIALLSLTLVFVYLYIKKNDTKYVIAVGTLCFILTILRMGGLIFSLTIFTLLLATDFKLIKQPGFITGLLLSISGFVFWRIYLSNVISGPSKLPFPSSSTNLLAHQADYLNSLGLWFMPTLLNNYMRILIIVVLMAIVLFFFLKYKNEYTLFRYAKILLASIVFYYGVRSVFGRDLDEIDRYLSEIYPLSILFIGLVIDASVKRLSTMKKTVVMILCLIWLIYPVTRTIKNATFWHNNNCHSQLTR